MSFARLSARRRSTCPDDTLPAIDRIAARAHGIVDALTDAGLGCWTDSPAADQQSDQAPNPSSRTDR
ncbi:hypothetical protein [Streptomyces sp. bgisy093]|uniref:hypothetical protein n=1 Tax=Streptomyces sp. bgisy093 TaxID=3413780 RepID=UPI003EB7E390